MASAGVIAGGAIGGGLLSFGTDLIGGIRAERFQRRMRRRQRRAIAEARQFADETVQRVTSSDLFRQAEQFISGTFGDAANSPIVQDFRRGIQQAQASRGLLFGGASVQGEAGGVAIEAARLRERLLPQSLQFALAPEQLRQSTLQSESVLRTAAATGAPIGGLQSPQFIDPFTNAIQSGIQGAVGGGQFAQELGGPGRLSAADLTRLTSGQQGLQPTIGQDAQLQSLLRTLGRSGSGDPRNTGF
jgi:hypothetical protein